MTASLHEKVVFVFDKDTLNNKLVVLPNSLNYSHYMSTEREIANVVCFFSGYDICLGFCDYGFRKYLNIDEDKRRAMRYGEAVAIDAGDLEALTGVNVGCLPFAPLKMRLKFKRDND